MGYYQGDFYAGARGDPGFFSFLGGLAKSAVGMIPGVGGIASKALGAIGKVSSAAPARATTAMIVRHPVISAAAAAGTVGALSAGAAMMPTRGAMMGAPGMRGFHMSKARKVNPASGAPHLVRNRRMRVTNVKALRRSIRRCTGFAHLAKRVLRFTSPRPPRGRAVFKHRRKKRV